MKSTVLAFIVLAALSSAVQAGEWRTQGNTHTLRSCVVEVDGPGDLANVTFKVGGNEVVITDRLSFPADLKKGPSIRQVVRAFFDQCVPYISKVEESDWRVRNARLAASYYLHDHSNIVP